MGEKVILQTADGKKDRMTLGVLEYPPKPQTPWEWRIRTPRGAIVTLSIAGQFKQHGDNCDQTRWEKFAKVEDLNGPSGAPSCPEEAEDAWGDAMGNYLIDTGPDGKPKVVELSYIDKIIGMDAQRRLDLHEGKGAAGLKAKLLVAIGAAALVQANANASKIIRGPNGQ